MAASNLAALAWASVLVNFPSLIRRGNTYTRMARSRSSSDIIIDNHILTFLLPVAALPRSRGPYTWATAAWHALYGSFWWECGRRRGCSFDGQKLPVGKTCRGNDKQKTCQLRVTDTRNTTTTVRKVDPDPRGRP